MQVNRKSDKMFKQLAETLGLEVENKTNNDIITDIGTKISAGGSGTSTASKGLVLNSSNNVTTYIYDLTQVSPNSNITYQGEQYSWPVGWAKGFNHFDYGYYNGAIMWSFNWPLRKVFTYTMDVNITSDGSSQGYQHVGIFLTSVEQGDKSLTGYRFAHLLNGAAPNWIASRYDNGNEVQQLGTGSGPTMNNNTSRRLKVTADYTTGNFTLFVDGTQILTFTDSTFASVGGKPGGFFYKCNVSFYAPTYDAAAQVTVDGMESGDFIYIPSVGKISGNTYFVMNKGEVISLVAASGAVKSQIFAKGGDAIEYKLPPAPVVTPAAPSGPFEYYRLNISAINGDQSYMNFSELKFKTSANGPSVAVGGTPFASSQYNASFGPDKVFDDSTTDNWYSASGVLSGTIGYHFASPVTITHYSFIGSNPMSLPKNFTLEASHDGVTWYVMHTVTNFSIAANTWAEFVVGQ